MYRVVYIVLVVSTTHAAAEGVPEFGNQAVDLRVTSGKFERVDTPVTARLPDSLESAPHLSLTRLSDGVDVPVQRLPVQRLPGDGLPGDGLPGDGLPGDGEPRIVWLIRQPLRAGQSRAYRLAGRAAPITPRPLPVVCRDDGRRLQISSAGRPVLHYNQAVVESPPGMATHYRRSGHIHPLFNPAGQPVTDDFPPDHAHQHAVFFPWVNTSYDGHSVNFWDQAGGTGLIEHVRLSGAPVSGPVFARFAALRRHSDTTQPHRPVTVLNETWTVTVYNTPDFFLVDLESRQQPASDKPLTIHKYHYGGMAIRGNRQWFDAKLAGAINRLQRSKSSREQLAKLAPPRDYLTSEGKTWIDGNATRARWVEMHGKIDGKLSGLTVMCHPGNFRAPQPVRLHPHKPYFCFAPMALGDFQVKPGQTYLSRYRFYVHAGPPDASASERLWNDYAFPPEVRLLAVNRKGR